VLDYDFDRSLSVFCAQLAELILLLVKNWLCVCLLTRVAHIIIDTRRDF